MTITRRDFLSASGLVASTSLLRSARAAPLPRDVTVYAVPQPVLTYLPPAPVGYRYERVGGDLVLIHIGDRMVVDIMLNVF